MFANISIYPVHHCGSRGERSVFVARVRVNFLSIFCGFTPSLFTVGHIKLCVSPPTIHSCYPFPHQLIRFKGITRIFASQLAHSGECRSPRPNPFCSHRAIRIDFLTSRSRSIIFSCFLGSNWRRQCACDCFSCGGVCKVLHLSCRCLSLAAVRTPTKAVFLSRLFLIF